MRATEKCLGLASRVCILRDPHTSWSQLTIQGLLKPIYEKFPIAQLPDAVEKLRQGKIAGRCVVDFNS